MKGVILAGGHGTRLHPTTRIINKHALMIFDRPLIFYPIETLRDAGIKDIIITLGDHDTERFFELLGDGSELGVNIDYHYHGAPKGIAYAINMIKDRVRDEPFIVHLGDNIFTQGLKDFVDAFQRKTVPTVLLKRVEYPERYGVPKFVPTPPGNGIERFYEKPKHPPSDFAVLGAYALTKRFFEAYPSLKASGRGEYEITDALNALLPNVNYEYYFGDWWDGGTFDDLWQAATWRRNKVQSSA